MTNNKVILGFVGDLAAGKGTICKYLNGKYNANAYRFSTMIRDILDRMYISQTRENLQLMSTVLRQNFGADVMSKVIAEDVKNDKNYLVLVEGIRRPTDITYLKENPGFHLIYITADSKIRWERLVERAENPGDTEKTYEQFLEDEKAEADCLIKTLGQTAEFTINNDGNLEEFYQQMEDIITKIKL